jgi:hypothetical protein
MDALMNTHPNFYEWKHLDQNQEPLTAWSPRFCFATFHRIALLSLFLLGFFYNVVCRYLQFNSISRVDPEAAVPFMPQVNSTALSSHIMKYIFTDTKFLQ